MAAHRGLVWALLGIISASAIENRMLSAEGSTVILGGYSQGNGITDVTALTDSFCPRGHLPQLPSARHLAAGAFIGGAIFICGGKEGLMFLKSDCWKLDLTSEGAKWEEIEPLPRAMTGGGNALAINDTQMWIFGGSGEEDYYSDMSDMNYYYDYVVEKPDRTVLAYDTITDKWRTVEGLQTPMALEGACTVRFGSMVVLIGGKDEDGVIHKDVWALDIDHLEAGWSNQHFPSLNHPRYHQGCSVVSLGTKTVIAVAGGIGECRNTSSTVESITLANFSQDKNEQEGWLEFPDMTSEHQTLPTVAVVKDQLAVLGGGEGHHIASDGHDKLEIFDGKDWQPFSVLNPGRIFAASVSVPKELLPDCHFEPNLGIHRYYQDRTVKSLESQLWMCNGGELMTPDTKVHKNAILTNSCTIPGCNYPHILHQPAGMKRKINMGKLKKRRKTLLTCQLGHNQATSSRYMVECSMHCRQGWRPAGDVNSTMCDSKQVAFLRSSGIAKPTNFTTDYLECEPIS